MTNGAIIQLVSKGRQNDILNKLPHSSLFKKRFIGQVNFAIETYTLPINLRFDNFYTTSLPYVGDLLSHCVLHIRLPQLSNMVPSGSTYLGWCNSVGHAIIDYVSVKIGHQEFDKISGDELEVYTEKQFTDEKKVGYNEMIHKFNDLTELETNATQEVDLYIPLPFWFSKRIGLSLPMISLWNHKIDFDIKIKPFNQLVVYDGDTEPEDLLFSIVSSSLIIDYIYLDSQERNKWKSSPHSYLYEQHKRIDSRFLEGEATKAVPVDVFDAVKQLTFIFVEEESKDNNDHFNYARRADGLSPITHLNLQAKGNLLFKTKLNEAYYRLLDPFKRNSVNTNKYIYQYSFATEPEEYQPTGFLNFSGLDNNGVVLLFDIRTGSKDTLIYVFAKKYNFFTIKNGNARLRFI